jgi:cell division ATPase FtsA
VPVSFDEHRCRAVETAARLAGLEVDGLIAEPNAAALANRYVTGFGGLVGIYDFGGGTFDFSIVDVSRSRFQVVAAAGDPWLGGDDIDTVLAEAAINQFWRQHKVDLRRQVVEYQRIRFACEEAKRALSSAPTATLHVRDVLRTTDGMIDLRLTLDGPTLARAAGAIIRRSLDVCTQTLRKAGVNADQLTGVYLCGGSSQMPAIREAVQRFFGVPTPRRGATRAGGVPGRCHPRVAPGGPALLAGLDRPISRPSLLPSRYRPRSRPRSRSRSRSRSPSGLGAVSRPGFYGFFGAPPPSPRRAWPQPRFDPSHGAPYACRICPVASLGGR